MARPKTVVDSESSSSSAVARIRARIASYVDELKKARPEEYDENYSGDALCALAGMGGNLLLPPKDRIRCLEIVAQYTEHALKRSTPLVAVAQQVISAGRPTVREIEANIEDFEGDPQIGHTRVWEPEPFEPRAAIANQKSGSPEIVDIEEIQNEIDRGE